MTLIDKTADWQERTRLLIGDEGAARLSRANVAVFGVGGVGGFTVEALVRSGIGRLTLVDDDIVTPSNLNRQIVALHSTMGKFKTSVAAERARDINPAIVIDERPQRYDESTADSFELSAYDYIVDAIDSVYSKLLLIERARAANTPVISSMGAGNKLDPTLFRVADIEKTSVCPLARAMRQGLKKRGIKGVKALYSTEPAIRPSSPDGSRPETGSIAFVPSAAGLIIAGEVVRDLLCLRR